jgi:hypothetical protein
MSSLLTRSEQQMVFDAKEVASVEHRIRGETANSFEECTPMGTAVMNTPTSVFCN